MSDLIGKTLGPYRILEQIGVGGMSTVYKAYQPSMDRDVAVKILPHYLSQDAEFAKRFQREARAIARLEHAHILPVYDYGEAEGTTYIAMRYVQAGTLKERLAKRPLPFDEIDRLIGQIGAALDYAHRLGVIHRDVKPSNVLIDDQGNTYLTDFGLARMMESSQQLTASGVGVGTPAYMSPEQGQGVKVDHRSDIYSLGVVLYEMITGHVPYEAETPMGVVLKHISDPLPLPRKLAPNVPEGVEKVILRALAKDPAHRFQTACEMVEALNIAVRTAAAEMREPAAEAARPVAVEIAPSGASISFLTRVERVWAQPRGKFALVGGAVVGLVVLGVLLSRLPGRVQIAAPAPSPTAAANATRAPATAAVAATAPPAASPLPTQLTLTLRLRLSSTSDWAELALLLPNVEIVEASTVEFSPGATLAAMDPQRRTIDLDQPFEAGQAGKQVSMVLDLVLAGVPTEWDLRFYADKGCLGTLMVEFFNLSVGEPVPVKDYIVEGCGPPSPRNLIVPVSRLAEVMTAGPKAEGGLVANWCDERWPGELCLYDPRAEQVRDITADLGELFKGDRGAISWSPDGQRLVYSAAREAGQPQKLYWINADGTGGLQFTGGESIDHEAAWSPGGEWIAFARDSDLWLVRPDGSDAHPLLEPDNYGVVAPAWSPDGRQIAYLSHAGGLVTGIWVIGTEGGQPRLVHDCRQACGTGGDVAWTPDGRKLLYWHFQKNIEQRLLVFADGSGLAGEINGVPYWWQKNFWPQWGLPAELTQCRIVYADPEHGGDIYARNCDGSDVTKLTDQAALDMSPAWSPDGAKIVFDSIRDDTQPAGEPQLYVMNADGANQARLTTQPDRNGKSASWSPDGRRIAFHSYCNLVVMNADGTEWTVLVPPREDLCADFPSWSPDSQRIAFRNMQAANNQPPVKHDIYVVNADGSGLTKLASLMSEDWGHYVAWSPDGRQVAFDILEPGQNRFYAVNADGSGEPVEIESIPESWYPWYWPQWGGEAQTATTDVMAEQARAFAEPILTAIADRPSDFADDFSTAGKGWGFAQQEGSGIQGGVARLSVKEGSNTIGNTALNRKDFVLQLHARVAEGDKATQLIVNFHNLSGEYWFRVVINSAGNTWLVDKNVPGDQRNLANGSGNVSPFGITTNIMIVARGPRAAIYLNEMPVAYFEDADFDTSGGTGLFCESLGQAVCEFDNVKFWNLANVPGLP